MSERAPLHREERPCLDIVHHHSISIRLATASSSNDQDEQIRQAKDEQLAPKKSTSTEMVEITGQIISTLPGKTNNIGGKKNHKRLKCAVLPACQSAYENREKYWASESEIKEKALPSLSLSSPRPTQPPSRCPGPSLCSLLHPRDKGGEVLEPAIPSASAPSQGKTTIPVSGST